jgi:electron-transferring-flavoprotein dehydrogenase
MPFINKKYKADHETLNNKNKAKKIDYPKPDGKLSFDRLTSVFLTSTNHRENQKGHLKLNSEEIPISINFELYDNPETRYCPAGVYEMVVNENNSKALQINHQNCIHCKSCDIKDPSQNINWDVPEGAEGPNYQGM